MSKHQIFEKSVGSLPQKDSRIVRVEFDKSDIGAAKANMPKLQNDLTIQHVK